MGLEEMGKVVKRYELPVIRHISCDDDVYNLETRVNNTVLHI